MKKVLFFTIIICLGFTACKNAMEKEIGEVDGLISMVDEIEKAVLSVDTSRAFSAKRQISADLAQIEAFADTLDKETAFRLDDYYYGKKKMYRFASHYNEFINQIAYAKKQLNNLKQDINNGVVDKDKFDGYYNVEQASIMELSSKVNKSVNGIEVAIQKLELDREEIVKIIEELKEEKDGNVE